MTQPLPKSPPAPRWISVWLAILAPLYVVSPLAVTGLRHVRRLPQPALYLLSFYALSQQVPALFAPEPLLASLLALLRTILIFGLIGIGVELKESQRIRPLAIGLLIVFATAVTYSVLGHLNLFTDRLMHPYMTPITLGVAGAVGLWLSLFLEGKFLWRIPFGLISLIIVLLSGSRGSLLAVIVGCLAGLLCKVRANLLIPFLLGFLLIGSGLYAGQRFGISSVSRIVNVDTTGRDLIWANTKSVIQGYPLSGVGSYRLGKYLHPQMGQCSTFTATSGQALGCPDWLNNIGRPWIIAHNLVLQQLAETGPLGLSGLIAVISIGLAKAFSGRRPLEAALLSGLVTTNLNDNTLLIPSPFFGEIFWILIGIQLNTLKSMPISGIAVPPLVVGILGLPLWASSIPQHLTQTQPQLTYFATSGDKVNVAEYSTYVQFSVPGGDYRAVLTSCARTCYTVAEDRFTVTSNKSDMVALVGQIRPGAQSLKLALLPLKSGLDYKAVAEKSWEVEFTE